MAHTAQLKIENKKYNLIECEYEFIQPVKENGQTAGRPSGGIIHFTLVAPDNSDLFLHDWMQNATENKDGQIVFEVSEKTNLSTKTVHFKRAYCIRLYEYFNAHNDSQMLTKVTISAAEVAFGKGEDIIFKNDQK